MGILAINFKNYASILGEGSVRLATEAEGVSSKTGVDVIVAPPTPMLALVASRVRIPVFCQAVDAEVGDRTTGAVLPEAAKGAGAAGTLLNHSEARVPLADLKAVVPRARKVGLKVCLCAETAAEVAKLSGLKPDLLAVEPPSLIASGVAVSRANPGLLSRAVSAASSAGYRGKLLCGAGITSAEDVKLAVRLGMDGVLVSSSVVSARDWRSKVAELASAL